MLARWRVEPQRGQVVTRTLPQATTFHVSRVARADITRWLHADGCPMDYFATAYAAMNGKIEYLKWLRERG